MNTRDKGKAGEELAEKYLKENGYEIIKTNFHFGKHGEVDIIAEKSGMLVFVEVKSRKNDDFGSPLMSMSARKRSSFRRAAEGYLYVNKISDKECRLDFIGISMYGDEPIIEHIENAF
jgi:putative endonuclease